MILRTCRWIGRGEREAYEYEGAVVGASSMGTGVQIIDAALVD